MCAVCDHATHTNTNIKANHNTIETNSQQKANHNTIETKSQQKEAKAVPS